MNVKRCEKMNAKAVLKDMEKTLLKEVFHIFNKAIMTINLKFKTKEKK